MVVCAVGIGTCICSQEEVLVAQFQCLNALDFFPRDAGVQLVDSLAVAVAVDAWRGGDWFGGFDDCWWCFLNCWDEGSCC